MTKAGRVAAASIAAIPIGIAIELGLEISTSLDRYNATLPQAIKAARHSVFMPHGIRDWIVWAMLALIAFVIREVMQPRNRVAPKP